MIPFTQHPHLHQTRWWGRGSPAPTAPPADRGWTEGLHQSLTCRRPGSRHLRSHEVANQGRPLESCNSIRSCIRPALSKAPSTTANINSAGCPPPSCGLASSKAPAWLPAGSHNTLAPASWRLVNTWLSLAGGARRTTSVRAELWCSAASSGCTLEWVSQEWIDDSSGACHPGLCPPIRAG